MEPWMITYKQKTGLKTKGKKGRRERKPGLKPLKNRDA